MRISKRMFELILVWSGLGLLFIAAVLIICLSKPRDIVTPEQQITEQLSEREEPKFQPEQQPLTDTSEYPENLLAPFVDMVSWVTPTSEYSINGVPDLTKFKEECGGDYYCLGFVRLDSNNPVASDGTLRWGWGGIYSLSENGNDGYQYEGIKESIQNLKDAGGNVVVSIGGQLGNAPWVDSQNINALRDMYLEIIDAYDLTRLDLDIEESNQGYEQNVANAKAIKKVQDKTGVEIVLTIPVMPYGWTQTQQNLVRAYLGAGVDVKIFNNMTMCYGSEVNYGEDFAQASIRATDNTKNQLIELYKEYGVDLSEEQAYHKLGATVDIGYENSYNPVFTTSMTKTLAEYAKEKDLAMYSFWCMNRDSMLESNSAIYSKYGYFNASLYYFDK